MVGEKSNINDNINDDICDDFNCIINDNTSDNINDDVNDDNNDNIDDDNNSDYVETRCRATVRRLCYSHSDLEGEVTIISILNEFDLIMVREMEGEKGTGKGAEGWRGRAEGRRGKKIG